ncbi:MAG: putative toxin-antitoxin system toxin component, PIN family [Candidatus Binataceae bacterium]
MRIVFDTNILVSAVILPGGKGAEAFERIVAGRGTPIVSKAIVSELLGVLARKFRREAEELAHLAVFLNELAETAEPRRVLKVLQDEADNRILECAIAGHADAIVTGDRAILALGSFEGIKILSLRQYLESD